mmetsp:Transcript_1011/g.1142  ORF Transcript_1011/g.1142 Transcript_1011/m.1142 type:complete len:84 (-) Transcript_1011:33-284(-)
MPNKKPRTHIKKYNNVNYLKSTERSVTNRVGSLARGPASAIRENSINGTITTPDKQIASNNLYANSSAKKSAVKRFKPSDIRQ